SGRRRVRASRRTRSSRVRSWPPGPRPIRPGSRQEDERGSSVDSIREAPTKALSGCASATARPLTTVTSTMASGSPPTIDHAHIRLHRGSASPCRETEWASDSSAWLRCAVAGGGSTTPSKRDGEVERKVTVRTWGVWPLSGAEAVRHAHGAGVAGHDVAHTGAVAEHVDLVAD